MLEKKTPLHSVSDTLICCNWAYFVSLAWCIASCFVFYNLLLHWSNILGIWRQLFKECIEWGESAFIKCTLLIINVKVSYYLSNIIGHYNPTVSIMDLVSYTTCGVRTSFIYKWRALYSEVKSNWQIFFGETFQGNILLLRQSFCPKSAERKSREKYFLSYFRFDFCAAGPHISRNIPHFIHPSYHYPSYVILPRHC